MTHEAVAPDKYRLSETKGVGIFILLFFVVLWVIAIAGLNLFLRWSIEQSLFESEVGLVDGRWLVNLVAGVLLFFPLMSLYFLVKKPRVRLVLRLWAIASGFVLLSGPAKILFLTSQNQSYLLLSVTLLLYTGVLALIRKKQQPPLAKLPTPTMMGVTVLAGVALATPWILWGALGSIIDVFFSALFAFSFAFFITHSIVPDYFLYTQPAGAMAGRGEYLFDGFVISVFLFLMASGLSQNGSQLVLVLSIPPAGWLIAALATAGRNRKNHGKYAIGVLAGALLLLPMAFFDMDELMLAIASSSGEAFYWANRAGWNTLVFLIAIAIVILILNKQVDRANINRRVNVILIAIGVIEFFILYLLAGQPGFFGDRSFVVMTNQGTPSQVNDLTTPLARRQALYTTLTREAESSQQGIRLTLEKWKIRYTPYYLLNGLEVDTTWPFDGLLSQAEGVDRVLESPRLRPLPQPLQPVSGETTVPNADTLWNLDIINAAKVHSQLGITGKGILIGQTDSGVDGNHPELKDSYRGYGGSNDYNWLDPWYYTVFPADVSGHGTGTTGIITGSTRGIAPDAEWIGCVNLARNLGNPALYLDCMQFMFAPYPQGGNPFIHGKPELGAMIVNNSWGCPRVEGCDAQIFAPTMKIMEAAGIFMSVAAGNSGNSGCSSITDPLAIYADVFTVGSVDISGELSSFSSKGPVEVDGSGREKPDIIAPGEQVLVAMPGGTYTTSSGTSFAAPHVSGVVALMWSANPSLIGDIATTRRILIETARPYSGRLNECGAVENEVGAGILDAQAAVKAAIEVK